MTRYTTEENSKAYPIIVALLIVALLGIIGFCFHTIGSQDRELNTNHKNQTLVSTHRNLPPFDPPWALHLIPTIYNPIPSLYAIQSPYHILAVFRPSRAPAPRRWVSPSASRSVRLSWGNHTSQIPYIHLHLSLRTINTWELYANQSS